MDILLEYGCSILVEYGCFPCWFNMNTPCLMIHLSLQVEDGVTMWSFTCWRDGEIERNPELRAARALKELEGWPEEVCHDMRFPTDVLHSENCAV